MYNQAFPTRHHKNINGDSYFNRNNTKKNIYMYICLFISIHINVCIYVHTYIYLCIYDNVMDRHDSDNEDNMMKMLTVYVYIYTHVNSSVCIYIYIHMYIHMCLYKFKHVYTYIHKCTYMYIYIMDSHDSDNEDNMMIIVRYLVPCTRIKVHC
jgi:magnesium-transporting ATPase (P-type)